MNSMPEQQWSALSALYEEADALPAHVLDAVSSQMSIIRTTTCLRTRDGKFHGFEGCNDNVGCCPMNCTHVWNYEQALAYLYPALERTMRDTDFAINTRDDGDMGGLRGLLHDERRNAIAAVIEQLGGAHRARHDNRTIR